MIWKEGGESVCIVRSVASRVEKNRAPKMCASALAKVRQGGGFPYLSSFGVVLWQSW